MPLLYICIDWNMYNKVNIYPELCCISASLFLTLLSRGDFCLFSDIFNDCHCDVQWYYGCFKFCNDWLLADKRSYILCMQYLFLHKFFSSPHLRYTSCNINVSKCLNNFFHSFNIDTITFHCFKPYMPVSEEWLCWH